MRNYSKLFLVFTCIILGSAVVSAQQLFTNIEVAPRWVMGPGIQSGSAIERGSALQMKWLQLDIDFKTVPIRAGWLDDVVFKYDILLPQTASKKVVLSGRIEYWSIKMDGQEHHVQAFVHPRILQRYAPGLRMRKSDLKDLRILVTVLKNDSPVGMGVYKPTTKTDPRTIKAAIDNAMKSMQTLKAKDSVFGRNETPWGVLNVSYYELIKRKR